MTVWVWAKRLRFWFKVAAGSVSNLAGIPGLVRNCEYHSEITDANIKVNVRELFTIIQVNGLEIYFNRLTGSIDGIGTTSDCKVDSTELSESAREALAPQRYIPQRKTR